ncbi:MAG: tRNA (adenosine(37)-N6)-threonylcarbamoyltransferase complex ATPase subunit type 1 TsaE [Alphaproteobacteria bacterium]
MTKDDTAGAGARGQPSGLVRRRVDTRDEAATGRLAATLAAMAEPGDVITLTGPVGAGKTSFARAFIRARAEGAGVLLGEVPSPTFTLVQCYEIGAAAIWHFDLYRLADPGEVWELGIEEAEGKGISLIEWPERMAPFLPADRLDLVFAPIDEVRCPDLRRIALTAPDRGSWGHRLRTLAGAGLAADQEVAP